MNLRSSAIVMKSLPATAWGDALLISREEARRIGYELEQAADRIEALKDALSLIETLTPMDGDTCRKARKAIAKVEGAQ